MNGEKLAASAAALVGLPFRLHGRDPATGLDCIGVLAVALERAGLTCHLPNGYSIRNRSLPETAAVARRCGFASAEGSIEAGDVVVCRISPCQFHIAIAAAGDRFVNAHAGLQRIVITPGPLPWPIIQHWRFSPVT